MATAKTTKKTKKSTEKTAKAKKVGRPRTKKPVVENVDAVVEEFLNDTAVETVFVKTEPTVESITTDATLQNDGTIVSGSLSKEQIDDLVESGVCVDQSSNPENVEPIAEFIDERIKSRLFDIAEEMTEEELEELANEIDDQIKEQIRSTHDDKEEAPDVEEIIREADEDIVKDTQEKPAEKKPKSKKRLTNRDVFGYDFMGVIYEY